MYVFNLCMQSTIAVALETDLPLKSVQFRTHATPFISLLTC